MITNGSISVKLLEGPLAYSKHWNMFLLSLCLSSCSIRWFSTRGKCGCLWQPWLPSHHIIDSNRVIGDTAGMGSIPGSGRYLGIENGNSLQYSCLENPKDRGAWWAALHGITESDMTECTHIDWLVGEKHNGEQMPWTWWLTGCGR